VDALPAPLLRQALTHASWARDRSESYGRLAFLGDSVLGLAIAEELYRRWPQAGIGRLTKVQSQVVSGRACAAVARSLEIPRRLRDLGMSVAEGGIEVETLLASERALASMCEAVIGACYIEHGLGAVAPAIVDAFEAEISLAAGTLLDFKSALQEHLAREGAKVIYDVEREEGPPHARRFEVVAMVGERVIGRGTGRSKKAAEQAAASEALERLTE